MVSKRRISGLSFFNQGLLPVGIKQIHSRVSESDLGFSEASAVEREIGERGENVRHAIKAEESAERLQKL